MSTMSLAKTGVQGDTKGQAAIVISRQHQRLAFCHRGGFATLLDSATFSNIQDQDRLSNSKAHGVLYSISEQHMSALRSRETGYRLVQVEVELYDSTKCSARAFISKPSLMVNMPLRPTKRYLDLMISGASEHCISSDYMTWLQGVEVHQGGGLGKEYFDTPSVLYANIAVICTASALLTLFLTFTPH